MPVRRATYYNLQVWRGGRKVLSAWPARPRYQMKNRWTFGGRSRRLEPGRYRWLVWPGFGRRSKADYGRRIGSAVFRVGQPAGAPPAAPPPRQPSPRTAPTPPPAPPPSPAPAPAPPAPPEEDDDDGDEDDDDDDDDEDDGDGDDGGDD